MLVHTHWPHVSDGPERKQTTTREAMRIYIYILTGAGSGLIDPIVAVVLAITPAIHRQAESALSVFAGTAEFGDVARVHFGRGQEGGRHHRRPHRHQQQQRRHRFQFGSF